MTDTVINPQTVCYRAFELMRDRQFEAAAQLLSNCLTKTADPVAIGLFHSALGVSAKLRGQGKEALRHYQRAEKLLPDDPALKLITARLLSQEFAQYGQAIKRCQKARALVPKNPVVRHHAHTVEGLAYVAQGKKRQAVAQLEASMAEEFHGFVTTKNLDFELVEACLKRGWDRPRCRVFLERAHAFAGSVHEAEWVGVLTRMLQALSD